MGSSAFRAEKTDIEGLWVVTAKQVEDDRGVVREFYRQSAFREAGLPDLGDWVQINLTESRPGTLRGLHGEPMHKLVGIAAGEAFGAYVDARPGSKTAGAVVTVPLRAGTQVLVPRGVCNGFQSLGPDRTQYLYCFDTEWVPGMAGPAVDPLDPDLSIPWPMPVQRADQTRLSAKDAGLPGIREVLRG